MLADTTLNHRAPFCIMSSGFGYQRRFAAFLCSVRFMGRS
jgi:hypothetical protein